MRSRPYRSIRLAMMWMWSLGRWKAIALRQVSSKSALKAATAVSMTVPYLPDWILPRCKETRERGGKGGEERRKRGAEERATREDA